MRRRHAFVAEMAFAVVAVQKINFAPNCISRGGPAEDASEGRRVQVSHRQPEVDAIGDVECLDAQLQSRVAGKVISRTSDTSRLP